MRYIAFYLSFLRGRYCRLTRHKRDNRHQRSDFSVLPVAILFVVFILLIPLNYHPSYAHSRGIEKSLRYQISILDAASIFGPGYFVDKLERSNMMITTTFVCSALTLGQWLSYHSNSAAKLACTGLFGFRVAQRSVSLRFVWHELAKRRS